MDFIFYSLITLLMAEVHLLSLSLWARHSTGFTFRSIMGSTHSLSLAGTFICFGPSMASPLKHTGVHSLALEASKGLCWFSPEIFPSGLHPLYSHIDTARSLKAMCPPSCKLRSHSAHMFFLVNYAHILPTCSSSSTTVTQSQHIIHTHKATLTY